MNYDNLIARLQDMGMDVESDDHRTCLEFAAADAIESLQRRLDAVREVYAGVESFLPQTAAEAYCLRVIREMGQAAIGVGNECHKDLIKRTLNEIEPVACATCGEEPYYTAGTIKALLETQRNFGVMMHEVMDERDRLLEENEKLRKEKEIADSFYAVAMADLKRERYEADRLREELAAAQKMLREAANEIADWGGYASEYFQNKHDLAGSIKRFRDAAITKEKRDE